MSHLDTFERMVADRVRDECHAEVQAILAPLTRRADAAMERGDDTVRLSVMELALLEWAWGRKYPVSDRARADVPRFNGLRVEVLDEVV